jgi:hypothetical protein
MSALIGIRIELYDAEGGFGGAMYCEDKFEVVAVPRRGDMIGLAAIAGQATSDSSLAEIQGVHGLAEEFPFMKVVRLEHYPAADHQVGGRPGCIVVLRGRTPPGIEEATAVVQLFGLKGWTIFADGPRSAPASPFGQATAAWLADQGRPRAE